MRWEDGEFATGKIKMGSRSRLEHFLNTQSTRDFVHINNQRWRNPIQIIETIIEPSNSFRGRRRIVHGDLHLRNVLTNRSAIRDKKCWIIDFEWTGESHNLKDYVLFESSIKFLHLYSLMSDYEIVIFENSLNSKNLEESLARNDFFSFAFDLIIAIRESAFEESQETDYKYWHSVYLTSLLIISTGNLGVKNFEGLDTRAVILSICHVSNRVWEFHNKGYNLDNITLEKIGEKEIISKYITKYFKSLSFNKERVEISIGDDGAVIVPSKLKLVISTDPCPTPVYWLLNNKDYYLWGWYSVIINLSDLGAMGASPLGMTLSIELAKNVTLFEFKRLLRGISDVCKLYKCPIIGGNLKEAHGINVTGTVYGETQQPLLRTTAKTGDRVIVIGDMGVFWAAVAVKLDKLEENFSKKELKSLELALSKPKPKIIEGQLLAKEKFSTCATDASDGVSPALHELSRKSKCDFLLDFDKFQIPNVVDKVAKLVNIDPIKFCLSWGNWELVATIPENKYDSLKKMFTLNKINFCEVGIVGQIKKKPSIRSVHDDNIVINEIFNERFSSTSYFSYGIRNYYEFLKNFKLTTE